MKAQGRRVIGGPMALWWLYPLKWFCGDLGRSELPRPSVSCLAPYGDEIDLAQGTRNRAAQSETGMSARRTVLRDVSGRSG